MNIDAIAKSEIALKDITKAMIEIGRAIGALNEMEEQPSIEQEEAVSDLIAELKKAQTYAGMARTRLYETIDMITEA